MCHKKKVKISINLFVSFFILLFFGERDIFMICHLVQTLPVFGTKSISFTEINLGLVLNGVNERNGTCVLMIQEVNDA